MVLSLKSDFIKYRKYSGNKSVFVLLLTQQGLWALTVYRLSNTIYRSSIFKPVKKLLLGFAVLHQKWIEIVTGISIPYSVTIGRQFYIGHFGGIIINANVVIGDNCNISQGVTIGVSGRGDTRGVPTLGNNVYIGANAVIAGPITIGDNCVIAANTLVTKSMDANAVAVGVPGVIINHNGSKNYI
ncbi:serine acetyltransferase [Olleya sp. Bg11-27]|nr:serine O-acetyltransferase [Olleya sp. Bg11-27]AUC75831.1 serine acetyltransferase [Olleya sp. Bg11-27]